MNIIEFLEAEKLETIQTIKQDVKEGYMKQEEVNEYFVNELNNEIEVMLWNNMKEQTSFDFICHMKKDYYKSMLGHGNNIKFTDLYEILKRLYAYHHESQVFTLKFDKFEKDIDKNVMEEYSNYGRLILDIIGSDWKLKVSDFQ